VRWWRGCCECACTAAAADCVWDRGACLVDPGHGLLPVRCVCACGPARPMAPVCCAPLTTTLLPSGVPVSEDQCLGPRAFLMLSSIDRSRMRYGWATGRGVGYQCGTGAKLRHVTRIFACGLKVQKSVSFTTNQKAGHAVRLRRWSPTPSLSRRFPCATVCHRFTEPHQHASCAYAQYLRGPAPRPRELLCE
jgi:hypothetical protein